MSAFGRLTRFFFSRLFESELMPPGLPQVRLVIWSAALILGPGLYLPVNMWGAYVYLNAWHPERLQPTIWGDKVQLLLLAMIPAGLISLVIWDGVFPDRRDAHVLSAMPLRNRLLVVSRLAALGLVLASIALGVALPIGLLYGSLVADYQAGFIRAFFAHVISSGLASAFVFCTLLAVQSVLVTIARGRWVDRLIVWGQFAAVILLLQMVIFRGTMVRNLRAMLEAGIEQPGGAMAWSPPLWFLGLSEVISGAPQDVFRMLAWRGLVATAVTAAAAVLLYVIGYRRLVHRALETQDVPLAVAPGALRRLVVRRLVRPLSAARPVAGAVLGFVLTSFARSRRHRLLYGIYIGLGCAIVVAGLLRVAALGPGGRCVSVAFDPFRRARHHVSRRRRRPRAVRAPDRAVRELGVSPDRAIVDAIPRRRRASRAARHRRSRRRSRSSCLCMPCSGVPRSPSRMPCTS